MAALVRELGQVAPQWIDRYEILEPIGMGGMAQVYLARLTGAGGFERSMALKILHPHLRSDMSFASDLLAEARIAAQIRHPNVLSVLDAGEGECGPYLVMEYVEGATLAELQRAEGERPWPVPIAMRVVLDVLSGLAAAHALTDESGTSLGLVHRDVSPQNLLVGVDGLCRVTDFGIAKAMALRAEITAEGLVKGKLSYMSPEQAKALPLDQRSDVWSAAVVAWELFAGAPLYSSKDESATLLRLLTEVPTPLRSRNPGASPSLERVLARALEPRLEARFPSADAFAVALRDVAAGEIADHATVGAWVRARRAERSQVRRERPLRATPSAASRVMPRGRDGSSPPPAPQKRRRLPAWLGLGSILVLSGLGVTHLVRGGVKSPLPAQVNERPPSLPVLSEEIKKDTLPPASADPVAPSRAPLQLRADRPVVSVTLSDGKHTETAALTPASTEASVPVSRFADAPLQCEAVAVDGSRVRKTLPQGAVRLELTFGKPRPKGPATSPLVPNPYRTP